MKGISAKIYLTAVMDSKICWRLDNFLGAQYVKFMNFWEYEESTADVKKKVYKTKRVALVHHLFRNGLGAVD